MPLIGRGDLVFEDFAGSPLFHAAIEVWTEASGQRPVVLADSAAGSARVVAGAAGATVVVVNGRDDVIRSLLADAGTVAVLDPLCPLVPANFVRTALARADQGAVVVPVRPVVDTVKSAPDGVIGTTVDRDTMRIVTTPVVLAAEVLLAQGDLIGALGQIETLAGRLVAEHKAELLPAPSASRRVEDRSALDLMHALDAVGHRLRER